MGFFDALKKSKGGYIFLSHSHDDIEKVREIRNSLEQEGFEPLCFYLKCLEDHDEIEDLIKREIDAREWFVFVNSENSRKSKWVTLEREYITRTNRKKILTIDLDHSDSACDAIHKITHNLRVFISNAPQDTALARRIKNKLEEKDYLVFFPPDSLQGSAPYAEVIANAVSEASKEGCVLALLTPHAMHSAHMLNEINFALSQKGNVIPVMVGEPKLSLAMEYHLGRYLFYRLSPDPTDAEIEEMIDRIGFRIVY